ncbi:HRDC domain-containing protein [Arcanobacterium sp. S3PF19]|uniref:HRDC domain-containing protein n=1 Tax=Arcanobacterium sp. S3PF19 TaxID=1219585 RepID=UPI000AA3A181|nr:HRDC domain-containing protein [Arcanobacterium sp. S3PF19]
MKHIDFSNTVELSVPRGGIPDVTHEDLSEMFSVLGRCSGPFAVDTERAMGIRYSNRAYLVQIKRADSPIFLLDPVGIEDRLDRLRALMDDEWILHAADQDLPSLRELGLKPKSLFDTELAGLILGFERVSLQSMVAEVLGYALAKEHSADDWSKRPLTGEMRAYAALDVELLHELREKLLAMLHSANRYEWFAQECREVLLRPAPAKPRQPWRKTQRKLEIDDRRALEMLSRLWAERDRIAQIRDVAPGKVIPSAVLGEIARRKPRSFSDLANSVPLRRRILQRDVKYWWNAVNSAWKVSGENLPELSAKDTKNPFPQPYKWEHVNPNAARRWKAVRGCVLARAEELGIRQEVLLKPAIQKQLAWEGWSGGSDLEEKLHAYGARPWQTEQLAARIMDSFSGN